MPTILPILSRCLWQLQALSLQYRPLNSFIILVLDLIISIASFGLQLSPHQAPRISWPPLAWYYGLKLIAFSSIIMLPCTWALALVETLCSVSGGVNNLYFPRRVRGCVLSQYLLWFFTNKLANQLLDNLTYVRIVEFERLADENGHLDRVRRGFRGALQRAPFTFFSLASVLTIYLLYDAITRFQKSSSPGTVLDTDSILGLLIPPICTFVLGFFVLQILSTKVKRCRQTLPSHTRLG